MEYIIFNSSECIEGQWSTGIFPSPCLFHSGLLPHLLSGGVEQQDPESDELPHVEGGGRGGGGEVEGGGINIRRRKRRRRRREGGREWKRERVKSGLGNACGYMHSLQSQALHSVQTQHLGD